MTPGDRVVYTAPHYEWLLGVGRWPATHVAREDWRGVVLARHDALLECGPACVLWPSGRESWHLPENLEVAS